MHHAAFLIRNQSGMTRAVDKIEPMHLKEAPEADGERKSQVGEAGPYESRLGSLKLPFRVCGTEWGVSGAEHSEAARGLSLPLFLTQPFAVHLSASPFRTGKQIHK